MSNFLKTINDKINKTGLLFSWALSEDMECAKYYCGGKMPNSPELEGLNAKLKSFFRAYSVSNLEQEQFMNFVPESFINKYVKIYSKTCQQIVQSTNKPKNYEFLKQLDFLIAKIAKQQLNVAEEYDLKVNINKQKCFRKSEPYIRYNLFGSVTGRLTTEKNSFPILTMSKDCRFLLSPTNDLFVELDYNACELRVLLALNGHEQPDMDLHDWNCEHVFENKLDRKQAKQKIFSWLYDTKVNQLAEKYYDKNKVKDKFYKNGKITNYYDRQIDCDEQHAVNYIVQSTASDMFLRRVIEIDKLLKDRKSKVAFMIHDSLVLDFAKEDRDLLEQIEKMFSTTELGVFKTNMSIGKNFGNLRKIK